MKKEFVPYDIALTLKELGFDEPCFSIYYSKDKSFSWHNHKDHTNNEPILDSGEFNISAPLYQQAFRWFREKQNIGNCISYSRIEDNSWYYQYYKSGLVGGFKTYEEAELACLRKLIEIVNQNKDEKY